MKNTLPSHLAAFILGNSKRIMNNFIKEITGLYNNIIYHSDCDSLYTEKKHSDVLDKTNLVGKNFCPGKNDYSIGAIFYDLFLAPKRNVLTINEFGITEEHKTLMHLILVEGF